MRYIDTRTVLPTLLSDEEGVKIKKSLERADRKVGMMSSESVRTKYFKDNGGKKWKPVKGKFLSGFGKKCWYTEVEITGAPLVIDHFRPLCDYWWLGFDVDNYRVSCSWSNSPKHNELYSCAGGKGDKFPLLPHAVRANNRNELANERPVLLDPCCDADCRLLAFQADGRPVISENFAKDADAVERVNQSKVLLNLDHPDFNTKREQLCNSIAEEVEIYEALPVNSISRTNTSIRLASWIAPDAPFSTAARFYLQLHRHHDWVQSILDAA